MNKLKKQEDKWQNSVLSDLDYIKKHLRYPWKSGMKAPLFVAAGFVVVSVVSFLLEMQWTTTRSTFVHYFLSLSSLVLALFSIARYLKSLKFTTIETGLNKVLNQQLICSFLQGKQLLIYEHPQCPDIIQILSRPVNINSEQREVLVFIAEENRVLVNSHFTENHWIILLKSRHDKTMAKGLLNYITTYKASRKTGIESRDH